MKRIGKVLQHGMAALAILACAPAPAGDAYPSRPITLVVGYAPGGGTDLVARLLAEHLRDATGQNVIVENKPGANATIAYASVARARPDGYRLLITDSSQAIFKEVYPKLEFDPMRDLEPIGLIVDVPIGVAVSKDLHVRSLAELVQEARTKPGTLNYATGGTASYIAAQSFNKVTGAKMVSVPFKGAAEATNALVSGYVQVMFAPLTTTSLAGNHNSGNIRVVAVSGTRRSTSLPDVPSAAEAGVPGFKFSIWWGLAAPKGIPDEVLARLNAEVVSFTQKPEVRARLAELGGAPMKTTPAQARERVAKDTGEQSALARELGLKF